MLLLLCTVATIGLVRRTNDPHLRVNGLMGWLLMAFLSWALMSALWTQDLSQTSKETYKFCHTLRSYAAMVRRLSPRITPVDFLHYTTVSGDRHCQQLDIRNVPSARVWVSLFRSTTSQHRGYGVCFPGVLRIRGRKHRNAPQTGVCRSGGCRRRLSRPYRFADHFGGYSARSGYLLRDRQPEKQDHDRAHPGASGVDRTFGGND